MKQQCLLKASPLVTHEWQSLRSILEIMIMREPLNTSSAWSITFRLMLFLTMQVFLRKTKKKTIYNINQHITDISKMFIWFRSTCEQDNDPSTCIFMLKINFLCRVVQKLQPGLHYPLLELSLNTIWSRNLHRNSSFLEGIFPTYFQLLLTCSISYISEYFSPLLLSIS